MKIASCINYYSCDISFLLVSDSHSFKSLYIVVRVACQSWHLHNIHKIRLNEFLICPCLSTVWTVCKHFTYRILSNSMMKKMKLLVIYNNQCMPAVLI